MNRFSQNAGTPRPGQPFWDRRHELSPTRDNDLHSLFYKEFFDKRSRSKEAMRDPIHYNYRVATDSQRPKAIYGEHVKNYWEVRSPRRTGTFETFFMESQEQNFDGRHQLSPSDHNPVKQPLLREYFQHQLPISDRLLSRSRRHTVT